ncbi:MAG: hypothetical protein MZV65_33665 [Chromatiales bacterium]|nr:hypothetical protein [Chromatiales bacterium]
MKANKGKYVLRGRGRDPDQGRRASTARSAARPRSTSLKEVRGRRRRRSIAIGSCASWGGMPSADPNPTGATGVAEVLKGKPVVTIPGCPPNPYNFLGTVLQFADLRHAARRSTSTGRPLFAYGRADPRALPAPRALRRRPLRAASSATRATARATACTSSGCKGPETHANCSTLALRRGRRAPGRSACGHPCIGCTEQGVGFAHADPRHRHDRDGRRRPTAYPRDRRGARARSAPVATGARRPRRSAPPPAPADRCREEARQGRAGRRAGKTGRRGGEP